MHIQKDNSKTGKIDGIYYDRSMCDKNLPCYRPCYWGRCMARFQNVAQYAEQNTALWRDKPEEAEKRFRAYLEYERPDFFRHLVGGDFLSLDNLRRLVSIAADNEQTHFLAYTKKHDYIEEFLSIGGRFPFNFRLRLSVWPNFFPPDRLIQAGFQLYFTGTPSHYIGTPFEQRAAKAYECIGKCDTCLYCWGGYYDVINDFH